MHPRQLATPEPKHLITSAVAVGTLALALASTAAPAPRTVYTAGAIVVWALAIVGVVIGAFPRTPIPRAAIAAGGLLAGYTVLTALSLLWASDQGNAFDQIARATGYTGLFVLVILAAKDGEGGWWLRGLAIGLTAVAAVALGPRLLPDVFGTPDASLDAEGRIGYPIRYWNGLAALMAFAAALTTWLSVQARTRDGRALAAAALVLPIVVLYMAQSRGGALALLVALAVLVIVGPARERLAASVALTGLLALPLIAFIRGRTAFLDAPDSQAAVDQGAEVLVFLLATVVVVGLARRALDRRLARFELSRERGRMLLVAAAIVGVLLLVAVDPVERFEDFKQPPTIEQAESDTTAALLTRSGGGRWQFWGAALDAFADEPLTGVGAGEFGVYWNQHGPFGFQVQNAHSLFLESLGELGLLGFALICGFFAIAAIAGAIRSSYVRDGAASVALAIVIAGALGAAFDFLWELPAVFGPVVVVAALCTGGALTPALINPPQAPPKPLRRSRRGLALAALTLAFGWASLVGCGLLLLTERALDQSRDAVGAGDFPKAIAKAEDAADLMPFSAEPRIQLGLAYQRAGDLVSARRALLAGIERADEDWRWWRSLALVDGVSGNLDAACDDIARARELNPRQQLLYGRIEGLDCPGLPKRPPR